MVPVRQLVNPVVQERGDCRDILVKGFQTLLPDRVDAPLRDHIAALPVVAAVDQHHDLAAIEPTQGLYWVCLPARNPHPEHVDGRAKVLDHQAAPLAHRRVTPIGADGQLRPNVDRAARGRGAHPDDPSVFFDQLVDLGFHAHLKRRITPCPLREEVEEIPLRHERDEAAVGG